MPTLAQFAQRIQTLGDQAQNAGARAIRRGTRAFVKAAVVGTPVDTGVHRSNWRVGVGRRPGGVIRAYAPGKKLGIAERSNANAAIAAAEVQIQKIKPGRGRGVDFTVFVANNAPAIGALNAGVVSTQQQVGWVDAAIADARVAIRGTKIFGNQPEFTK